MKRILVLPASKRTGKKVKVAGWINTIRFHGKMGFLDLRDASGILQIVLSDKIEEKGRLRPEWAVEIVGRIQKRPAGMENPKIETGKIELLAEGLKVLSESRAMPFPVDTLGYEIDEEKRLQYRYLDLRRKRLQNNLKKRQAVIHFIRNFLQRKGFVEIETPILTKATPEGARDFLVPSRLQPGKFYALPQSPQQYKQLLQVAGLERYFQIARCFRDEDPRANRAYGEFTQLDIEMAFVSQKDILQLTERLFIQLVRKLMPEKRIKQVPFPVLNYQEAIKKYQTDKPDLRKNKKDKNELAFCFVVDWPLFEKTSQKEIVPFHHPFTAPKDQDLPLLDKDPLKVRSWQHDLVLNGTEIGGGSMRITDPVVQKKVFEILGHSPKEIQEKFGHLLEAFQYGVPPHGGIAPGIDRFLMVSLGEPNLREVIAFPMTAGGKTAVMEAPGLASKEQLKELGIEIRKKG